jgi:hypothetical protein
LQENWIKKVFLFFINNSIEEGIFESGLVRELIVYFKIVNTFFADYTFDSKVFRLCLIISLILHYCAHGSSSIRSEFVSDLHEIAILSRLSRSIQSSIQTIQYSNNPIFKNLKEDLFRNIFSGFVFVGDVK